MTTITRETSDYSGEPVYLFDFIIGTRHYRYTTATTEQTYNTFTWTPASITRGRKRLSDVLDDARLDITCDRELDVVLRLRQMPLPGPARVIVWKSHLGETDWIQDWQGVVNRRQVSGAMATLGCVATFALLEVQSHRLFFSTSCPYVVYDELCGVDRQVFKLLGVANAISGLDVTVSAITGSGLPANRFAGGMLEWVHPTDGAYERRWIAGQSGSVLSLVDRPHSLEVGDSVTLHWGCDRSKDGALGCLGFSNQLRFGGEPYMPPDNPFGGKTLF